MNPPPTRTLQAAATVLLLAAAASDAATDPLGPTPVVSFDGDAVEFPLRQVADRFLVEARIGDAGPYAFLIDTGASISVVDSEIATELALTVSGELPVGAPGGPQVLSDRVLVPRLTVGGLTIEGLSPVAVDIAAMSSGLIEGVLGMDVFREFQLTLDPFRKVATFSRDELSSGDPGVVAFDDSQGRMTFEIDVAGQTVPTQIDTGAPGSFTLPGRFRDQVPTDPASERKRTAKLVGGSREITVRRLEGAITFAGLRYEHPDVAFMDPSPDVGNIGGEILNQLVVSVDGRNGLIAFRQPERKPATAGAQVARAATTPRRLGIQFGGAPGKTLADVGRVDAGSLADVAGFEAGDVIVSLNGKSMSEYGVADLGSTIRGSEALRFVVERNGRERVILIDDE